MKDLQENAMKTAAAKIGSRYQLVLPKEARQALGVEPGDVVLFLIEGNAVRLFPRPRSYTRYTRGLGKEMWAKLGGGERLHREEQAAWE